MSFPSSHHTPGGFPRGEQPSDTATSDPAHQVTLHSSCQAANSHPRSPARPPLPAEGDHQLEKLEFALAIALTRGDATRSRQLREDIDRLGGNHEEPGT